MKSFRLSLSSLLMVLLLFLSPPCLVFAAAPQTDGSWAIQGKAVTDDGIKDGWLIIQNGVITAVGGSDKDLPGDARKILWDGYIFPGLIDTHNHFEWNSIPRWTAGPFSARYDWLDDNDYQTQVRSRYNTLKDRDLIPESRKYAEVRAVLGGTTLIQGSYTNPEPDILVRNLDTRYKAVNYVLPRIAEMPDADRQSLLDRLKDKSRTDGIKRLFLHIGEGLPTDARASAEFPALLDKGFAQEGVVVIHGLALSPSDFNVMAAKRMFLVWSPVSNWNLYRAVCDMPAALRAGVLVSLAPDWTVSGSDNLLEEMKFAYALSRARWGDLLSPRDIFKMATSNAATVAGVDSDTIAQGPPMGKLAPGYAADLFLAPILDKSREGTRDPYESLLRTCPKNIHLVFVAGKPIYGDRDEMYRLAPGSDELTVQNEPKAVVTTGSDPSNLRDQQHLQEIETKLQQALPELAPLIEN